MALKFFFPHGFGNRVQQEFDWETETGNGRPTAAHELLGNVYDGVLTSRAEFTAGLLDEVKAAGGIKELWRTDLPTMGDCGAFTYRDAPDPVYTVDELVEFYTACDFDIAASLDHIVQEYWPHEGFPGTVPDECVRRQELSLSLAEEFIGKSRGARYVPMGVAQGWSPQSLSRSIAQLQDMGYVYVALGGLVALPSSEILRILDTVDAVRHPRTRIHLFGVGRLRYSAEYEKRGVVSIDTTSPFVNAFRLRPSYYAHDCVYDVFRVPRLESSRNLKRLSQRAGIPTERIAEAEQAAVQGLLRYGADPQASVVPVLTKLLEYAHFLMQASESIWDMGVQEDTYRRSLTDRPWDKCPCALCKDAGIRIMFQRGTGTTAEYAWRRGYHNTMIFHRWVQEGRPPVVSGYGGFDALEEAA